MVLQVQAAELQRLSKAADLQVSSEREAAQASQSLMPSLPDPIDTNTAAKLLHSKMVAAADELKAKKAAAEQETSRLLAEQQAAADTMAAAIAAEREISEKMARDLAAAQQLRRVKEEQVRSPKESEELR